ncbi:MFS transporter (plasmid) [Azospirillum humicireducens]|uniref:MFS transporter n=1 Tax=Azospirillum humicireducens TaxID=1226968 RepID=A0A2R4VTW6_9PROT|nr:MFS transporter [Azospirillum humicireducens]AWB07886.1 MFS transporter [Azospirillum humicireducens]
MKIKGLRWWIIVLICLGTVVNYLARNSLGVMAPILKTEMNFTTQEYSYVVAAFQLAYTVMQPVCGYIVDFLGLKIGFALFAVLWSVSNCLHGFATGWVSLALFRGMLGLTEAAAIPSGIKAVGEWFPKQERSVAVGWFNAGTSLGAMLAPPLVVYVQMQHGWSAAFIVTGALGFVFAALWWMFYRSPGEHPNITAEEHAYIVAGQNPPVIDADGVRAKPKVKEILSTKRFWGIAIPRFLAEPAWQTFSFWIPLYLATERGMDIKQIAMFAWMPFLAADFGGILGGYLSPFFMKHFKFSVVNSRLAGIVIGAICMIGPGLIGLATDAYTAIALFCIGGFAHQMISALINTLSADVFESHEVATANGLTGMASWTGGLTFSLIVGALATTIGFAPLFVCLTVFDLVGACVAIALLRDRGDKTPAGIAAAR